ncbi:hypothetical protein [Terrabacter terrigena]|uniref:Uncharacterized protein n=1 Tax=Terrabacter terrigena TaxID=574718 RepID=A0ABW3MXQ8_9MICO
MRPGQRVVVDTMQGLVMSTVVDIATEERTRVLLDGRTSPLVVDNILLDEIPDAVEALITHLMRVLAEATEDERPAVTTQLRRLTGHADLIGFARSLRSAS